MPPIIPILIYCVIGVSPVALPSATTSLPLVATNTVRMLGPSAIKVVRHARGWIAIHGGRYVTGTFSKSKAVAYALAHKAKAGASLAASNTIADIASVASVALDATGLRDEKADESAVSS